MAPSSPLGVFVIILTSSTFANRPRPFKIYPQIQPLPLPRDVPQTGVAALSAISEPVPWTGGDAVPDVHDLARILYFSAGITKERAFPGGEIYFRAAACTGALLAIGKSMKRKTP